MATVSPTPTSHFTSLRRPSSRQILRQPLSRSQSHRVETFAAERLAPTNYMNDSSDDEIAIPVMKFSAETNALLNDIASTIGKSSPRYSRKTPEPESFEGYKKEGSVDALQKEFSPPESRVRSPYPIKRVVRLSGTPSTLRRSTSLSTAVQRRNEKAAPKAESPLVDLNTPVQVARTIRIPITANGNLGKSGGSSGRISVGTDSARNEYGEADAQEYPSTVARSQLATSQGSVSRYGQSTIGRTRYGEEAGSMRVKRVTGMMLRGPARRGRRRMDEEEQSPMEEHGEGLNLARSSQEPQSLESQQPESQSQPTEQNSETDANRAALYSTTYRDFASGSPAGSRSKLHAILRSQSPPPPTLSSSQKSSREGLIAQHGSQPKQPVFKVPAPRPDLSSAHDKENEAPPTFKRNKQGLLIQFDKMEKAPIRPESMDMGLVAVTSPERRPLAPRSQNTPRRPAPPPPPYMSVLDAATRTAGAAASSNAGRKNRIRLNGKVYTKLDCVGRGGSARVYRVMAENSAMFALKKVTFGEDVDETTIQGFKGEINLLQKLAGNDRVIALYDHEYNAEKGILSLLMEMGELDMKAILDMRVNKAESPKLDTAFVRFYWKEMIECIQAIHEHDIVHSDLKPANFVLVKGQLKLIDFGIANAIQTDETVNVHRENQVGTPNYMSPESLIDANSKPDSRGRILNEPKLMKLGKPSDIWSMGCILYQMTYGRPPFDHIANMLPRCQAIINSNYAIEYPSVGIGSVPVPASLIRTLKRCLNRDQFQRPTATELLHESDTLLTPVEYADDALPITQELLGRILLSVAAKMKDHEPTDAELLKAWPQGYFDRLRKNMADGKAL